MLYRLLRNNKESGPYTAAQLKELGLKPYDLLWTEGRGAAWQYASEIPELKSFAPTIEEQPFDRFYKKKEGQPVAQQQPAMAEKKVKPRFRISGDKVIMVEAGNMEVANNGSIKETMPQTRLPKEPIVEEKVATNPQWQEIYSEWQPQKKTVKIEEPVEIETKFSESLDDLKKRYAEKVLHEKVDKKASVFSSPSFRQNLTAGIALLVLVVGGYVGYTLKQKDAVKVTDGKPALERADVIGDNSLSAQPVDDDNSTTTEDNKTKQIASQPKSSLEKNNEVISKASPTPEKQVATSAIAVNKPIVKPTPTLQKKDVKNDIDAKASPVADTKATNAKADKKVVLNNKTDNQFANNTTAKTTSNNPTVAAPLDAKPVVPKQNVQKKIDDYVAIKKVGGAPNAVQNVRLLVSNVTDFPIDLAVVDIQYFDSKGKYQKGETMYVKNIDGGNNVEVRVPDSDKSSSIKYKVSLVSSEKKTLYLVAD